MATGKKYYWIKIKESFMTSDKVDFLMSQKNGANYIVLYQMLCLKTINTDGELCRELGEVIIPFDEYKIQRDCKYFEIDTIRVAFELYKKLGMIYVNSDNMLQIADFNNMVGFETDYANQKRNQKILPKIKDGGCKRLNAETLMLPNGKKQYVDEKRYGGNGMKAFDLAGGVCEICGSDEDLLIHHGNGYSNEQKDLYILCKSCHGISHSSYIKEGWLKHNWAEEWVEKGVEMFHTDIRDKILDNRYKNKDKELDIDSLNNNTNIYNNSENEFKKPTLDEIQFYANSIKTEQPIDCERFYNHYEALGWYVGKTKMVDWKAMVRKWGKRQKSAREVEMEKSKAEKQKETDSEDMYDEETIKQLRQSIKDKQEKMK